MSDKDNYTFNNLEDVDKLHNRKQGPYKRRKVEVASETRDSVTLQNANIDAPPIMNIKSSINTGNYKQAIFSDEQKVAFLEELSQHGIIKHACEAAKVSRLTFYYNYQSDEEFRRLVDDAFVLGAINIEDEAKIRAIEGIEETVYFKGEPVGTIRKYSDFLITFLLKGNFPHKYGGLYSEEVTSNALGQPKLKVATAIKSTAANDINYSALSDEQLRDLIGQNNKVN